MSSYRAGGATARHSTSPHKAPAPTLLFRDAFDRLFFFFCGRVILFWPHAAEKASIGCSFLDHRPSAVPLGGSIRLFFFFYVFLL
eukprot:NODE_3630_length_649_cov_80.271667_g2598_i0.p2 GENE.NODE_3630_length_649_cov_80.271667_g2598_i0~~NODE_3630_length_649_cov_80.271667_g2598_i0.p2  ORF type:complete len:85 (+),score=13.30 NODE_3630_length_649_cov_80.271667_g2598_i0:261-515(+)